MKHLLKVCNLSSKNMCEKLVGWKSLLVCCKLLVRSTDHVFDHVNALIFARNLKSTVAS